MRHQHKKPTHSSRVYAYHVRVHPDDVPAILTQMRQAKEYQNALIDVEIQRREARDVVLQPITHLCEIRQAALDTLVQQLEAIQSQERTKNRSAKRRSQTPEIKAAIKALRLQVREARQQLRASRHVALTPEAEAELQAINNNASQQRRALRAECGLYWGTYLKAEYAAEMACKEAHPRHQGFHGEGLIGVQLQNGLSLSELFSGQNRKARLSLRPGGRKRGPYGDMLLRMGTDDSPRKLPIWARMSLFYHRPLPPQGFIKWIVLTATRTGTMTRWQIQFTVEQPKAAWIRVVPDSQHTVGVDLNWRRMSDGRLRVATWKGSDGQEGHLFLEAPHVAQWDKVCQLQEIRTHHFNTFRTVLADWIDQWGWDNLPLWMRQWQGRKRYGHPRQGVSPEEPEETPSLQTLRQWQSPGRLAALVNQWRHNRFAGDEDIFRQMYGYLIPGTHGQKDRFGGWLLQNLHLYNWMEHLQRKAINKRKYIYHQFALELARHYRMIVMEDTNWRDIGARPGLDATEEQVRAWALARQYRRIGSPGVLRQILRDKCASLTLAPSAYTTITDHACGQDDAFDAATEVVRTCRHCGYTEDQDIRAATNLLHYGQTATV